MRSFPDCISGAIAGFLRGGRGGCVRFAVCRKARNRVNFDKGKLIRCLGDWGSIRNTVIFFASIAFESNRSFFVGVADACRESAEEVEGMSCIIQIKNDWG